MVSIIVPVYNTVNYLKKCVESICHQTYNDIEIILVDDGSTDGSQRLCDELEKNDRRIKVVHQTNKGQASARKKGLSVANGEYVLHVDSDDWIEPDMVEVMYKIAKSNQADIVTSGFIRETNVYSNRTYDYLACGIYDIKNIKEEFMANLIYVDEQSYHGILPHLCLKLIKRQLLNMGYKYIDENIQYGEDTALTYSCCGFAKSVVVTRECFYHYVMRNESITHSKNQNYLQGLNRLFISLKKAFMDSEYKDILLPQLDKYLVLNCIIGLNTYVETNNNIIVPCYFFPSSLIDKDKEIVLYGAGRVGKCYYRQLKEIENYNIILWVDEQAEKYRKQGFSVSLVDEIKKVHTDYFIIIAVQYETLALQIKNKLKEKYNVPIEKTVWVSPITIV